MATVAYMPGHQVGDRDARLLRTAAGQIVALAGDAHEPGHALDDEIVAGAVRVGAVLPEAGDRRVDEPRVQRGDGSRSRGRTSRGRRPCSSRRARRPAARGRWTIRCPSGVVKSTATESLPRLHAQVIGRLAGVASARILEERRAPRPRVVAAARPLDLDDRRAEIREQLRAPRPGEHAGEVEDGQVGERAGHRSPWRRGDAALAACSPPASVANGREQRCGVDQDFSATRTSSSIFLASPKSMRLLSL